MMTKEELRNLVVDPKQLIAGIHVQFKPTMCLTKKIRAVNELDEYDYVIKDYYTIIGGEKYKCRNEYHRTNKQKDSEEFITEYDVYYNVNGDKIVMSMKKGTGSINEDTFRQTLYYYPDKRRVQFVDGKLVEDIEPTLESCNGHDLLEEIAIFLRRAFASDKVSSLFPEEVAETAVQIADYIADFDREYTHKVYVNELGDTCCEISDDGEYGTGDVLKAIQYKSQHPLTGDTIDTITVLINGYVLNSMLISKDTYSDILDLRFNGIKLRELEDVVVEDRKTKYYVKELTAENTYGLKTTTEFDENGAFVDWRAFGYFNGSEEPELLSYTTSENTIEILD